MNENIEGKNSKLEAEAIIFLGRDFDQCFEQVRYYDEQIVSIFKFLATFYTTIVGAAIGLYKISLEKSINLSSALIIGLSVALLFGICMFFLIVRNRVYFVFCMRYINEQRGLFISVRPLGFENHSRYYTDYKQPPFFNWLSSQSWWLYVVSFLNSVLLAALLYITKMNLKWIITIPILLMVFQLVSGIVYLKTREKKSASAAVFGK